MKEKIYIIKIGGNIIDDPGKLFSFLKEVSQIREKKIIVHGGGKLATAIAEKLNIEQQMIEGRRITDAETLKVITMVYAGYVNKNIVALLQSFGCNSIGLTGADGNLVLAHKRDHPTIDYGFVGDIDSVNQNWLMQLLQQGLTPVIAPVSHDKKGQLLNTNADTIAKEVAGSMANEFSTTLVYCFEKKGVLKNTEDENSVITHLDPISYKELKEKQVIFAGMIPKLDNAFAALNSGIKKVIIGKAEEIHHLINGSSGTTITNE